MVFCLPEDVIANIGTFLNMKELGRHQQINAQFRYSLGLNECWKKFPISSIIKTFYPNQTPYQRLVAASIYLRSYPEERMEVIDQEICQQEFIISELKETLMKLSELVSMYHPCSPIISEHLLFMNSILFRAIQHKQNRNSWIVKKYYKLLFESYLTRYWYFFHRFPSGETS